MSQDCNLATVARAVTLSRTHTHARAHKHKHTHTFVRQDVSVILAPPVCSACPSFMTNSFCLPALLPLRLHSTCRNTFSIPIMSFPHPAHLPPYFSPIRTPSLTPPPPLPTLFTRLSPSDHPSPHYLSGCSPLLPLARFSEPFLYCLLVSPSSPPPPGLLHPPSSPLFL